jgi:RNA polymerase sigma-70 factor (ECF subfamily)
LRSADRLDPARDARAWLFGIASNVIRHHRRAEQRRIRAYATVARQPELTGRSDHPAESETGRRCFSSRGQTCRTKKSRQRLTSRSGRCGRGFIAHAASCGRAWEITAS